MTPPLYAVAKNGAVNPLTQAQSALEAKVRALLVYFDTRAQGWPEGLVEDVWQQWLWRLSQEEPGTVLTVIEVGSRPTGG